MNDSVLFRWALCLLMVSFCLGILCVTPSFSKEKPAISATKPAVKEQQPEVANEDQPEIFIETSEHDAGEVYEGTEVNHSFIVKNKGKGELRINKVKPG